MIGFILTDVVADRSIQRGESGEFQQAGNGAAVQKPGRPTTSSWKGMTKRSAPSCSSVRNFSSWA